MPDSRFPDIEACLFDAYGTLFDVGSAVAKEAGALGEIAPAVSATWRQKQLEYTWLRSLMRAHEDFWQVTGDALDYALSANGVDDPALRERLMELYLRLDAYPEVPGTLQRLRATGRKTAILSNGAPGMLNAAIEAAGLSELLDDTITVEPVGVYKPAPEVYRLGVTRSGAAAERICFVSANAWDVAGAAHFGFKVAWLNRFGQPAENLPGKPLAEITKLDEVADLLDA